jgi:hypothetical protein
MALCEKNSLKFLSLADKREEYTLGYLRYIGLIYHPLQ